jgi:uncharacterized protein YjbI with pentapeptide repeats
MKFDVANYRTGKVQFTAEIECAENAHASIKLGLAVKWAINARADLAGAYLAGANLARANLARADLAGAYLAGANLARANLARADLAGADLAGANLAHADLADANLARANLADANLADALKINERDIPVLSNIDDAILAAIEAGGTLDMKSWHGPEGWCGTTHCRAGWAVHLAGQPGKALEDRIGTQMAAALIYRASRPGQPSPWFFAPEEVVMADIRKCAAEQNPARVRP